MNTRDLVVYQTVVTSNMLYGCETYYMSAKDEQRISIEKAVAMGSRQCICTSVLGHLINEEILEEAKVVSISMVMSKLT